MKKRTICFLTMIAIFAIAIHPGALADLEEGLIACWTFDKGTGDVAEDSVGEHHGEFEGSPKWTDDSISGKALYLDVEAWVVVPSTEDLNNLPEGFSVMAWIKGEAGQTGAIVDKSVDDSHRRQHLYMWNSGVAVGIMDLWIPSEKVDFPKDNVWYHVAVTYDMKEVVMYVNGEVSASKSCTAEVPQTESPLTIGNRTPGPWISTDSFEGIVDEVAFYNRALSADEVKEISEKKGLSSILAVFPQGKLAIAWGGLKIRY